MSLLPQGGRLSIISPSQFHPLFVVSVGTFPSCIQYSTPCNWFSNFTKVSNGNLFKKNCGGILESESHKKGKNIKYRQLLVSKALVLRLGFQFIYIRGKEEMMDGYGQVCKGRGKGTQLR